MTREKKYCQRKKTQKSFNREGQKKNFSEKTKKKIDQCFNKKVPQKEYVKNFLFRFQK